MRIYHVATLADWKQAEGTGTYTTSTFGRSRISAAMSYLSCRASSGVVWVSIVRA